MNRELFACFAIAQIPKILTLMDRNPHSPTYGCCDRNFWHYKIIDFPSGMAQEFVWPLALVYDSDIPNNPFYQQEAIRNWVEAGILYAARSAHWDGSCDDYFPFERAGGAAAFSLLACLESYQLLGLDNYNALQFFEKRADWLAHHRESGRLTNHQALIVLCLERLSQLLKTTKWDRVKTQRLNRVLSWQHGEGWFQEYEGCDPGYQTLTIGCLAQLEQARAAAKSEGRLRDAIAKAVALVDQFMHPDGSYGGEYASRNTYNFFPHGFELVGSWLPEALQINDRFLVGLANNLAPCYADDHIIGHHTWSYLLAWRNFLPTRPPIGSRASGRLWLPGAQLLIERRLLERNSQLKQQPGTTTDRAEETAAPTNLEMQTKPDRANTDQRDKPLPTRKNSDNPTSSALADTPKLTELYLALNKGGVFKFFCDDRLIASDSQFSLQVRVGKKIKTAVGHLVDRYQVDLSEGEILVQGHLGWAKQPQMTPAKLLVLRLVMLSFGRFFPNLIRKILHAFLGLDFFIFEDVFNSF